MKARSCYFILRFKDQFGFAKVAKTLPVVSYINYRDSVSSGYPNSEKRVENTKRSGVFLMKFEVFG